MHLLSHPELLQRLHYCPEEGVFTWIDCPNPHRNGTIAGRFDGKGYRQIKLHGCFYLLHRLAWFYVTGEWPVGIVDHRDGVITNNRWGNLRDVTHRVNSQNQRKTTGRRSRTGVLGASWNSRAGRYESGIGISVDGKKVRKYLGLFDTPEQAHAAYVAAKREHHEGNTL